jgi:hypothetical protein
VLSARKTSLLARPADLEDEKKRIEAEERKTAELSLVLSTLGTRWQSASVTEKDILLKGLVKEVSVKRYDQSVQMVYRF